MKLKEQVRAFPSEITIKGNKGITSHTHLGMTLRDYFAAKAMQGIITIGTEMKEDGIAKLAYRTADAMLKQREL